MQQQQSIAAFPDAAPLQGGILALMTDAFGGYGGIAQYNRDFIAATSREGHFAPLTILPRLAPDAPGSLPVGTCQKAPIHNKFAYAARAFALTLQQRPAVIFNAHLYHGPLARRMARLVGAKLVSQLHGTEVWTPIPLACRAALEASDLVLTVSRDTRARTLDQIRIAPERVVVVNNTVGEAFQPGDRGAARERFGLTDELAVLTVARLDTRQGYKGHDRIIPLVAQQRAGGRNVVYLIAGDGPDRPRLEQCARDHGIAAHVRFLGKVPGEALTDLYRAADLFALPSTGEGFGIAFLEAMACGTPAIGLAVGGAPDALVEGELGMCVSEAEFPQAFVHALSVCRQRDPALPAKVRARFGFDAFADQIDQQLARLLQHSDT